MEPVISFDAAEQAEADPSRTVDTDNIQAAPVEAAEQTANGERPGARAHARAVEERGETPGTSDKTLATGGAATSGAVNVAGPQAAGARRPDEATDGLNEAPRGGPVSETAGGGSTGDADRPQGMARPDKPDDLKKISGVGPKIESRLNDLGIYTFEQIAAWQKAERDWVDSYLSFKGRIERDQWVSQAKALAAQKSGR